MDENGQAITPELVLMQLKRLKNSSQFSHSKRYPAFLDFVVSKAVSGNQDDLKERTIGVEAFGRAANYDLNSDPIVRVTAGEVRRRLTQYYYEPGHRSELRIELYPGSYVPEFKLPSSPTPNEQIPTLSFPEPQHSQTAAQLPLTTPPLKEEFFWTQRRVLGATTVFLVLICGFLFGSRFMRSSPYDQLWKPVIAGRNSILVSVGSVVVLNPPTYPAGPSPSSVGLHALFADPVALSDAIALSNLQRVLSRFSISSTIQSSTDTTYSDLQNGPVLLVSAFDNPWTMRLTDSLRFHFVQVSVDTYEIADRTDPVHKFWRINTRADFKQVDHDYALVARFHDPTIDQYVVVVAGIGEAGTVAASELLTEEKYLSEAMREGYLPKRNQNWEAVIETKMIDGKPGPPRILASYTW